ncbi:MAG: DNRLRE domain-containing protein, partial [Promethearchaeota archaeon]
MLTFGITLLIISMSLMLIVSILQDPEEIFFNKETIKPLEDAEINNFNPNSNSGGSEYLHIGEQLLGHSRSFIKFKIPSKINPIQKAIIRTYWYSLICNSYLSIKVHIVSNEWSEKNITWNNAPSYGTEITSEDITDGMEFNIDITDYISNSSELSICILEQSPYCTYGLQSDSKEGGGYNSPKLMIQYQGISIELGLFIFSLILMVLGTIGIIHQK